MELPPWEDKSGRVFDFGDGNVFAECPAEEATFWVAGNNCYKVEPGEEKELAEWLKGEKHEAIPCHQLPNVIFTTMRDEGDLVRIWDDELDH